MMQNRPFSLPRTRRGKRPVVGAGALVATAAICVSGTLAATPAAAASAPTPPPQGNPRVSAAVLDLDGTSDTPAVYGTDVPYDTASIVKVDILAATLLAAQDAGRPLDAKARAQAEIMIERSDNDAATALWRRIGLAPGLEAANKRLGLQATQGGPDTRWGLTRTTPSDQIRLLRAVFDTTPAPTAAPRALNEASRTWIRTLMTRIADEQAWGVSAATGSAWALKNGWLQRNTTGLWDINSVGQITAGGHRYLVAVLSDGNPSMKDGIARVESAACAAIASTTAG